MYREDGYGIENPRCTLYMPYPYCAQEVKLWALDCPRKNPACRIRYDGVSEGVLLSSSSTAIALELLYDGMQGWVLHGKAPSAYVREMSQKYEHYPENPGPPFLGATAWRRAFYPFCYFVSRTAHFICPMCGDSPAVVISDGILLTILKKFYTGTSVTTRVPTAYPIAEVKHKLNSRVFVDARVRNRTEVIKLLKDFAAAVKDPTQTSFTGARFDELKTKAAGYFLVPFLEWVWRGIGRAHPSDGATQSLLTPPQRKAVARFISRCLATSSSTISYLPYRLVAPLRAALATEGMVLDNALLRQVKCWSRQLYAVLVAAGAKDTFAVTPAFQGLLEELCSRSKDCTEGPGIEVVPTIPVDDRQPGGSAASDAFLRSGVLTGLPQLRQRPWFPMDSKKGRDDDPTSCRHGFEGGKGKTGGMMTMICEHGVCFASFIVEKAEGRDELFSFLICYLREAPKVVVYDFACAFHEYCLNRLPDWFKDTLCFVDKFHWNNHEACSVGYNVSECCAYAHLNTEIAEQNNSALRRMQRTLTRAAQGPFMVLQKVFLGRWNEGKIARAQEAIRFVAELAPPALV